MHHELSLFILYIWAFCLAKPLQAELVAPTADSRYRIELTTGSNTIADTGYFLLWPNDRAVSNTFLQVAATNGTPVGHQILWSAEGEPLKVLFDCSSHATAFDVSTGPARLPTPDWTPGSGLILETRTRATGEPTNAAAILKICNASSPVLGRSLIPEIFLGIHPHGPTADFVSMIKGTIIISQAGDYDFATISEDASCLLLDGKVVAQWPDWHGYHEGRKGQHHGRITLTKGAHQLEYLQVEKESGYTIEAAWRPPGHNLFELIPASAFAPVAMYKVTSYMPVPSGTPGARFSWDIDSHFTIGTATMILVSFTALSPGQNYLWEFDDGTREASRRVEHVFLSPGMRTVKLEVQTPAGKASVTQKVLIHPQWTQEKEQPKHHFGREMNRLAREDLHAAPVADLASVYRIAADEEAFHLVRRFASLCLARKADFDAAHAGVFCEMALYLQRPELQEDALAEQAFKMITASPLFSPDQKAWATLHLAGLLLDSLGRTEEARNLLSRIDNTRLSDSDQRLRKITEAEVLFAEGHLDLARKSYISIGTTYPPGDTAQALKRQARLEAARDYLRRKEFDSAEQMVRNLEWHDPEQHMSMDAGLIMIRIYIERKEFRRGLVLLRRLLPVAETDIRKSELLSAMTEICLATDKLPEATNTYQQLLKNYPYSEATARAKDQWGDRFKNKQ